MKVWSIDSAEGVSHFIVNLQKPFLGWTIDIGTSLPSSLEAHLVTQDNNTLAKK